MIQIGSPWVFCALILPFIVYFILPKAQEHNNGALKVPFFNQLVQVFGNVINFSSKNSVSNLKYLITLIWILIVISGANIKWLGDPIALPQTGRDLLLAIDLSGSMKTPDMMVNGNPQTRIEVVKKVAKEFIDNRGGDKLGLVLFGTRPYLQTPLTFDGQTVSQMLDDASVGMAGPETAMGDAIGLAIKQLINYPNDSKALILLTDGGNNAGNLDPLEAAKIAAQEHIKIYTIGLGAKQMTIQTMFGPQTVNPSSDLDISGLKQIAIMTGGKFFRAEDGDSLEQIYAQINKLEPIKSDEITIRPTSPLYPWTLGLALGLSFILILVKIRRS